MDKFGSALARLELARKVRIANSTGSPKAGDVVVARALSESVTYGNLELPSGRLAKINRNDVIAGVFGKRRALKGFVGDVPASVKAGDRLHLLNMGGLIGECKGHHSSFSDAIEVEVLGIVMDDAGDIVNIGTGALQPASFLLESAPIVVVAGSCMNSGKTVAATEIIKQASHAGLRVAGAKMSGVAALRDTFNMEDHGAFETASFIDCGLPSTVEVEDLAPVAKAILNHLNEQKPELIVVELGDGIVGGYSVESLLKDSDIRKATTSFVFCASDYVGVIGGDFVLRRHGIEIDVVAGSVTDSQMGEDYIQEHIGIRAGNARRDGKRLFDLIMAPQKKFEEAAA
ncbi:MAG TPA: hypothetical protein VJL58_03690 [Pyrinomonadaceae bacterium]|nr:hypothetical protein [Pyrinomonadaceae bacterium]